MTRARPLIYLVACEASGDQLGAKLIEGLRAETAGAVEIIGIGGPAMQAAGLTSLFDPADLALIGIFEVLPKVGLVLRRVRETVADIVARKPDVLVTIDSWGFTGRIHQRLAHMNHGTKRLRYVAPQVWAWRAGRAAQLARWIQHLLTLLPFEPAYFTKVGLPATWVGHPVLESGADRGDGGAFRKAHGIAPAAPVLTVLPGSRRSEIKRLMPTFEQALAEIVKQVPDVRLVVPTVPHVAATVRARVAHWPWPAVVTEGENEKFAAFAASGAALAASGTVTLELAMAGVAHVIAYRLNTLTALVMRVMLKTKFVNLINVLLGREAVPERLQENCRPEVLAADIVKLLREPAASGAMKADFKAALAQLRPEGTTPSRAAARAVLAAI